MATAKSASYAWVWVVIIVVISAAVYMYVRRDDSEQMVENLADRTRPVEEVSVEVPSISAASPQREQDLASRVLNALREQQAAARGEGAAAPSSATGDSVPTIRLSDPPPPPPPAALVTPAPSAPASGDPVPTLSLTPSPVSERPSAVSQPIPSDPVPSLSSLPPPVVEPVRPSGGLPPSTLPPTPAARTSAPVPVAPRPAAVAATPAPRPAARAGTYTVKPGDNYSLIAEEVFGDQKHWVAIQSANPGVDPDRLQIGQVIKLPDLAAHQSRRETEVASVRSGSGPRVITVESGDVLSTISQKVYGKSSLWRVIYEANRDQLVSPDDLYPGMKLKIPAVSSSGATSQR